MITKEFILAGRAVFTLQCHPGYQPSKDYVVKDHYTYRVWHKAADETHKNAWFVQLLTGPDNSNDYTYLGMLYPGVINEKSVTLTLTKASKYHEKCAPVALLRRVLQRVWNDEQHLIEEAGFKLFHTGRCGKCGRVLSVPKSILTGIGPECEKTLMGNGVR